MPNLDELIAEAESRLKGDIHMPGRVFLTGVIDALEAATRVPVQGEPNEPTGALALVEEVIAIHADRIGTHYGDCYKYHVACLAVAVKHRLAGKGKNE